ncbi:hypothetical protein CRUP_031787, partial [Coryphaenoides rupestris]
MLLELLLELSAGGSCQVIVNKWETHHQPRTMTPTEAHMNCDDGQFGIHGGVDCVDSGWLTCQAEVRLRLHYSKSAPVSITKKKYKKSRFRIKLNLEGYEEEGDEEEDEGQHEGLHEGLQQVPPSPTTLDSIATTLEISMISSEGYKSRHSQPDCGYALEPSRWTEYSIQTMDPDNLELTFEFFEEDLGEHVVQGDTHPGHVGTACLLSSSFSDNGKDAGVATVPIMGRNSRQTIGKGAAYVEFDVQFSKDSVPIKNDKTSLELIEVPVKALTYDQLQLLKLAHATAMKSKDHKDLLDDEDEIDEDQPFPNLSQIFQAVPEHVGFNIELKWICQLKDGSWDGNQSSYFNMNSFLDVVLTCVLQMAGRRRIVFSCFDPDMCSITQIAMSFAQSENILTKGLVVFCWGDDNNDHSNRQTLREQGIDGLIYDRICDEHGVQPNIFKVEGQHTLQQVISDQTRKNTRAIHSTTTTTTTTTTTSSSNMPSGGDGSSSG